MLRTEKLFFGTSRLSLCRRSTFALAALAATLATLPNAKADVLATATRGDPPIVGGFGPLVPIDLTDSSGSTTLAFSTDTPNQKVVITYNAECQVVGGGYVTVVINVDGVAAAPASGTNFALCATAPGSAFQPIAAVRQSVFVVPNAGAHSVSVSARGLNGSANWQLDDTSLVVEK
jgi:hypothetical protein